MFDPSNLLRLEALVPSRWLTGQQRLVQLRLHNPTEADLKSLHLKVVWPALAGGESSELKVDRLKHGTCLPIELPLTPVRDCEDVLQLHVFTEVGPFLCLNLRSEKLTPTTRSLTPGTQNIQIHVKEMSVGDKQGYGQILEGGGSAHVGHNIHVDGSGAFQRVEDWLEQGRATEDFAELPLHVASESCHNWVSTRMEMDLVGLPGGKFIMGASRESDPAAMPDEGPQREVYLDRSFWMGRYPVTQGEWLKVMGSLPVLDPVVAKHHTGERNPVARITWHEACDFCRRLTQLERDAGALPPGYAYRLPTEAEWEYACRAGTKGPHYAKPLAQIASCVASGRRFTPVGSFDANGWGLHDMLGLVGEWCQDAKAPYRPFATDHPVNAVEPEDPAPRVVRGGCYQGPDTFVRASARDARPPDSPSQRVGLRVVLAREPASITS